MWNPAKAQHLTFKIGFDFLGDAFLVFGSQWAFDSERLLREPTGLVGIQSGKCGRVEEEEEEADEEPKEREEEVGEER